MAYFLFLFLLLGVPILARIQLHARGSRDGRLQNFAVGVIQDLFVSHLLLLILALSSYTYWLSASFISLVQVYYVVDSFLYSRLQIRMRFSLARHLSEAKSFMSSAIEVGLPYIMVVSCLTFLGYLVLLLILHPFTMALNPWIAIGGVGIFGILQRLLPLPLELRNVFLLEIPQAPSLKGEQDPLRSFQPANEEYSRISPTYPLLKLTSAFKGPKKFRIRVEKGEKPHVILLSLESFRAKDVGCLGSPYPASPQFDRLSKEGILFSQFQAAGIPTARSVFATLFGVYPPLDPIIMQKQDPEFPLIGLPHLLREEGYRTGYFQSGPSAFQNQDLFFSKNGFEEIHGEEQIEAIFPNAPASSWGYHDEYLLKYTLEQLKEKDRQGEAFFQAIYTNTNHHPWILPDDFPAPDFGLPPQSIHARALATHYYSDFQLGKFVDGLREAGLSHKTLLFIMADTGQPMGEHHHNYTLFNYLYQENQHIPLLILADGRIPESQVIDSVASQVDFMPTVMDILGLSGVNHSIGNSLCRQTANTRALCVNPELRPYTSLIQWPYKLTATLDDGKRELYDLSEDPQEQVDLAASQTERLDALSQELASSLMGLKALYDDRRLTPDSCNCLVHCDDPNFDDRALIKESRRFSEIRVLNLIGCPKVADKGIQFLSTKLRSLKALGLNQTAISDRGLQALSACLDQLDHFSLAECQQVSGSGLATFLRRCNHLSHVDLHQCSGVDSSSLQALIRHNPELRSLILKGCLSLNEEAFEGIAELCPQLQKLDLQGIANFAGPGIALLCQGQMQLRELNLLDCGLLDDDAVLALAHGQELLTNLSLTGSLLSDRALGGLTDFCPHLHRLVIDDCPNLSTQGLSHLFQNARRLETVELHHCPGLEDSTLEATKDLHLGRLVLSACPQVSPKGLSHLKHQPIRFLYLADCQGISFQDLEVLGDQMNREGGMREIRLGSERKTY